MIETMLAIILAPMALLAIGFTGLLLVAGVAIAKELKRQNNDSKC